MKQIPLTQGKFALVDDEDFEYLNQWKWKLHGKRYAARAIYIGKNSKGKYIQKMIWMHRVIMNTPDDKDTDHINVDGLDNQKANLRICTRNQNLMNTHSHKGSTSKYKGVYWHSLTNKWATSIVANGKKKYLGEFLYEEDAAVAYNMAAIRFYREFAKLNLIYTKAA